METKQFVYIIQSVVDGTYYVGHSHDPYLRLTGHNDGWTQSTKAKRPWKLLFTERHNSKG